MQTCLDDLIISDIYLGSDNCHAKDLVVFLEQIRCGEKIEQGVVNLARKLGCHSAGCLIVNAGAFIFSVLFGLKSAM